MSIAGRLESLLRRMATSLEACCEVTNNNAARLSNLEAANPNPNPIAAPLRTHVFGIVTHGVRVCACVHRVAPRVTIPTVVARSKWSSAPRC